MSSAGSTILNSSYKQSAGFKTREHSSLIISRRSQKSFVFPISVRSVSKSKSSSLPVDSTIDNYFKFAYLCRSCLTFSSKLAQSLLSLSFRYPLMQRSLKSTKIGSSFERAPGRTIHFPSIRTLGSGWSSLMGYQP